MIYFEYDNLDYNKWKNYNSRLDNKGIIGLLQEILIDLDVTKGFAQVDSFNYFENIGLYLRTINKISNYIIYNEYYQRLIDLDESNREIEKINEELKEQNNKKKKVRKTKNNRKQNIVVSVSSDLFDNSPVYIYDNLDTGDVKVSHVKPKEETDYKDLRGIKFNFNKVKKK